jgi:hypothetical protein
VDLPFAEDDDEPSVFSQVVTAVSFLRETNTFSLQFTIYTATEVD